MHIRARFECKSVKQVLPIGNEKVRYEIVLVAKDICEGDNHSWSPLAQPDGTIFLVITDEEKAKQFKPGYKYASCLVGVDQTGTWRQLLNRICNLSKTRESSGAWSKSILWLMPGVLFENYISIANVLIEH